MEGIIAGSSPEGEKINTKLDVTSLDQLQAEMAAVRAGQPRPKRASSTVFYKGRDVVRISEPRETEKKKPAKKTTKPKGPKNFSEQRARYGTILDTIDTLFRFNKASADPRDGASMYGHLRELPGAKGLSEQLDVKDTGIKFAQSLLDQPKLPAINVDFWRRAKKVLNGRTMDESLPTFWDEYTDEYGVTEPSLVDARLPRENVTKRGPGRPRVESKAGVDSIRAPKPFEAPPVVRHDRNDVTSHRSDTAPDSFGGLPGSPLDNGKSAKTEPESYVGPEGFKAFYRDKHSEPAPKPTSLFSRPGDTRRELEAWKAEAPPDSSELPHGWRVEDGKIDLPDGRRIIMDLDSHKLGIIATKKAGHTGELAKWAESREENERLLEAQFPMLGDMAREKIIDQLNKAAFSRKMAQIDEWFEDDNFDHLHDLRVEIGKAATELATSQRKAEKLFRRKGTKLAFETAQAEYAVLQKRYLEALTAEHELDTDKTERDVAILSQIIGMNQAVEDAREKQMSGVTAWFRKTWQKHPKSRLAVSTALTAVAAVSAATGIAPVAAGAMGVKKAIGAYGTYVGTENAWKGFDALVEKRQTKKIVKANEVALEAMRSSDPELVGRIDAVLQGLDSQPEIRNFAMTHLKEISHYLEQPGVEAEYDILTGLIGSQQQKLSSDVKSARIGKALGLFTSVLVTGVGLIPWHHDAAPSGGGQLHEQATSHQPPSPGTTVPMGEVSPPPAPKLTREQFSAIYNSWTKPQQAAFGRMSDDPVAFGRLYSILGPSPTPEQLANFDRLFT